jgi:hypothetical protein
MKRVMVRYKVKPDRAGENEQFIKQVFDALDRERPAGLHYTSLKLADGVSFVHIATHDADGSNPLTSLPEFKAFTAGIKDRCEELPVSTEWTEVGSYDAVGIEAV